MKAGIEIKYIGHGGFSIIMGGKTIVVDPFITENPKNDLDAKLIKADYILLTHGHFDHVADAELIAKNTGAEIISSFEVAAWYEKKGLKTQGMNIGGKAKFEFGTLKYVNAVHSSELPDGSYGGPAGGFVIWNDDNCFYIAGDTALTWDMKLIPMTCPPLDIAILPMGDYFTMGYEDAVIASDFIACDNIVACHHSTFDIIHLDKKMALEAFEEKNKKLVWLEIGEVITL